MRGSFIELYSDMMAVDSIGCRFAVVNENTEEVQRLNEIFADLFEAGEFEKEVFYLDDTDSVRKLCDVCDYLNAYDNGWKTFNRSVEIVSYCEA